MRIAKFISHCGYCSRRDAEKLIIKNKVKINSLICNNPATNVLISDEIFINNKKLKLQKNIKLWKFYKPTGVVTTSRDEKGRKTIYDLLPNSLSKIISIGRLDINSEGLILLTNNGDLARYFELPKSQLKRVYKVKVQGNVEKKQFLYVGDTEYDVKCAQNADVNFILADWGYGNTSENIRKIDNVNDFIEFINKNS